MMNPLNEKGPLVLAIDQGTTGTTALVVTPDGRTLSKRTRELPQHFPKPGLVEHDPDELFATVLGAVTDALDAAPGSRARLAAIGITNQRETSLIWDAETGVAIGRALVWQDRRTHERCRQLLSEGHGARVREVTGLVIDPYFSATKVAWMLDAEPALRKRAEAGGVQFGTVDSYLVKRLCGGAAAPHVIEITNASRTLLMDLEGRAFSAEMCGIFGVPLAMLPTIVPSVGIVATTRDVPGLPDGIPISGIAGDQHAALFGQGCFEAGMSKCTYGTGAFVLTNTGAAPLKSEAGLLSTVAWQIGDDVTYALEGSAFVAGAAVQWLRDGLGLIDSAPQIEALAREVNDSGGVAFVPALAGLGAPYWDPTATGLITGITRGTTRAHLARATLEGIAFEVDDLLRAMHADLAKAGFAAEVELRVDGGAAQNNLLLELQASYSHARVVRPTELESTARGAALLASLGAGLLRDLNEAREAILVDRVFDGQAGALCLSSEERRIERARWEAAVARSRS